MSEFAFPLPGIVISEQLGPEPGQIGTFRTTADAITSAMWLLARNPEQTRRVGAGLSAPHRSGRKNSLRSATNSSGCSRAAK